MNEKDLQRLMSSTIMDDVFGRKVFEDQASGLELLKILGFIHDDTPIVHYKTQKDIVNLNHRSLKLDIYIITNQENIEVELENTKDGAVPQRARLHASEMDVHMSFPRMKFKDLPNNIVIFICSFDYFKKGLPFYTIQRTIKELGIDFEDGSTIIYLNGDYRGDDEIGKLNHDLTCTNPNEIKNEILRNRVKYFKETEGGQKEMGKTYDELKKEGFIEGRSEGLAEGKAEGHALGKAEGLTEGKAEEKLNSLKQIMVNLNMSIDDAMNALGILESEKEKYKQLILNKID